MKTRTGLSRLRYELVTILVDCAIFVVGCCVLVMAALLLFVLAAQLYRLGTLGDWRSVPLSELLDILTVRLSADANQGFVGFILAFPATLILLLAVAVLYATGRLLSRIKAHEHRRIFDVRQKALIGDIERAFEKSQRTPETQQR